MELLESEYANLYSVSYGAILRNPMTKILYLHQYFNTPEMSGGTRSYEMARRFVTAGHEVHMITSRRDRNATSKRWETTEEAGIHVHWFPVPYDNTMSNLRRIIAFFWFVFASGRKAVEIGGNIVFATSTPLTIALPAVKAKKKLKIPMVFEVRDLWPELPIAIGAIRNPVIKLVARKLERYAYKHSSSVIALSPGMADGVAMTGYPREQILVIPNSCDTELFDVGDEPGKAFRARNPWLGERPLVVYIGTFGKINGVKYLVDVAKETMSINSEIRFLLVGSGAEFQMVSEYAAQEEVLEKNLWIWPAVPKSGVPEILSAATIATSLFIDLPEMWNNSANKVFDAMASGTPVAINYEGWQADLLRTEQAGIVLDVHDHRGATEQLLSFVQDQHWLNTAARNAARLAKTQFSREILAKELLGVLECSVRTSRNEP